jgi:hypothetical protein
MSQLAATPLWQAMPFVRANRLQIVPAVWFYGATLSAMNFARILDNSLEARRESETVAICRHLAVSAVCYCTGADLV